ncbi:fibronectin type III domain-containing protein [Streptomyces sp. H27-D2]|uniref:fibronectin type III domain-containing protein n=1 Tax=Streptomyces sp. H27-D2 TaxID=3046304 RepID=UPI002DB59193|nr:fibronectin type III domain-containing protein [Streptomyces sp. H27-D2]MEC4019353.1 fibronectin type III domain-containing protein [Streptomyces sp. H27-D2]
MTRIPGLTAPVAAACLLLTGCGADDQATPVPAAPTRVTVDTSSSTSVHVMWQQAADKVKADGYEVYQGAVKVKEVPGRRQMVDVSGLKPSAVYKFSVRARNADGDLSQRSPKVRVTMPTAAGDDQEKPTRPAHLRGKADGARTATLSWGRSTDNHGVASYDVYQAGTKIHSVSGDRTTARVTGLRPGTDYTFTVKARDTADNVSPASRALDTTTASAPGDDVSTAPTGFRAKTRAAAGEHFLDLAWIPPKADGTITDYQVYLNDAFATTVAWGSGSPKSKATHSLALGKKPDARYTVKIRAKLPDGKWGAFSTRRTVAVGGGRS